jgi:hypothetical protein
MAGPAKDDSAGGGGSPRRRFEQRYRRALEAHFRAPTNEGLAAARELGRRAPAEGVSIIDVANIHMAARRGLFPEIGDRFNDIDDFLRESLTAFEELQAELVEHSAQQAAARRAAEQASLRFRTMRDVATELAQATTRRAVAAVMLAAVLELSGGSFGAVVLFRSADRQRRRRPEVLATVPSRDNRRVRALHASANAVGDLLQPYTSLELVAGDEIEAAIGAEATAVLGVAALVVHPIVWHGRVAGAVIVTWSARSAFDAGDRDLALAPVVLGAGALERAGRYDTDHEIALTLQRGMMSLAAFDSPETPWSAHYSAATRGLVGGDWYDVIDLDGRIGFAIGDIVGRGLEAAVAMGQVRSASRALANCFDKPDEVVEGLDRFAASTGCGQDSSMVYLTINRHSGEIAYCVAGHPPPLVLPPDGAPMWLEGASGALLGRCGQRSSASSVAEPGTVVVIYTDGLVERRGESLDEGLARLADAARTLAGEERPNHARRLAAMIASPQAIDDDVAVLYVTFLGREGRRR